MAEPQQSRLLNLPPELRNYIYELVLVENSPTTASLLTSGKALIACQPPLTSVSHLIRHEALPIFYGQNSFKVSPTHSLHTTVVRLPGSGEHVGRIRRLELEVCSCQSRTLIFKAERGEGVELGYDAPAHQERCQVHARHEEEGTLGVARELVEEVGEKGLDGRECLALMDLFRWPANGPLTIKRCELHCQYCDAAGGPTHPHKFAWFLRRHVLAVHIKRADASHPEVFLTSGRWT